MKGYCDICHMQYGNIAQHRNTKTHKEKAAEHDQNKPGDINGAGSIPPAEGTGGDNKSMSEMSDKPDMSKNSQTIAGIQIIDGNTGKKGKSTLDQVLEIAFSEQFAPITLSIIDGIVKKFQGNNNPEVKQGNLIKTVGGLTYEAVEGF